VAFAAGVIIRLALLPADELSGELDRFVGWVHHIATDGLGTVYGDTDVGRLSLGPVIAYIWGFLALIQPAFATVTDASDAAIRVLMKLPPTLADFGLAVMVVYALRDRSGWAAIACAAALLHPVIFDVSAWWGQYESILVLSGLGATIAAVNGRNGLAAALLAVSLMTMPQAIPFVVPFVVWFFARGGVRQVARAAAIAAAVIVVLWLPFIPYGGPADYLATLRSDSAGASAVLSVHAWNPWWIVQELTGGGALVADDTAAIGPVTFRQIGLVVTIALWVVIGLGLLRDPRPERLILALAASVMTYFTFMTQMVQWYSYAAVVIVLLLFYERRIRLAWEVLGFMVMLNLFAAVPVTPELTPVLPAHGPLTILGAIVMTGCTVYLLWLATTDSMLAADVTSVPAGGRRPVSLTQSRSPSG
jgi:hypothetical protein